MTSVPRTALSRSRPLLHSKPKPLSSSSPQTLKPTPIERSLVSALKTFSFSLLSGQQLHALALKSGLHRSNLFVRNGLINLYAKCGRLDAARQLFLSGPMLDSASWNIMLCACVKSGRLDDARKLFDEMPRRDCVSFTTMIMGLANSSLSTEALDLFRVMIASGVKPNEVTLGTVVSSCSARLTVGKMVHGLAVKTRLDAFVLVATNLVHAYAVSLDLDASEAVFGGTGERNVVTWNAMLNGYAKAGRIDSARDLFERIPVKDLVSWSTMIDGYLRADYLEDALVTYREMLQEDADVRPNEVMLVDLVSVCGRYSALREGQQLHTVVLKTGLDCHSFVQATLIHFYAACQMIELACLQFETGVSEANISCWNALVGGLLRNGMLNEARRMFDEMPDRDVVSWSTLISGYVRLGKCDFALELFFEMVKMQGFTGVQPNEITLVSVLSAVASCGTSEQGKWIHSYITSNSNVIHLTDNLSAALIDMYAKRGSIGIAMQLFFEYCHHIRKDGSEKGNISPWNAIICGLAMHGDAEMCLKIFSDLQKRSNILPNSITFIGVLGACCHAGLVDAGRKHFESMRNIYRIEPSIKHYGCMVDLLGRAGCLEEAEKLIEDMPMEADVLIWGSMLAAARTHGNVELGEKAAESLARLEPSHGAGRVLLSNIYADAGRWDDVSLVRRTMQSRKMKKDPGYSGVL